MRTKKYDLTILSVVLFLISGVAFAGDMSLKLRPIVNGMTMPNGAAVSPVSSSMLYVVDQPGIVWSVDPATGQKRVFLDTTQTAAMTGVTAELRDLIFDPQYAINGFLYTYTFEWHREDHIGQAVVTRWQVSDPTSPSATVSGETATVLFGMRKTGSLDVVSLDFDENSNVRLQSAQFVTGVRYTGSIPALRQRLLFGDVSDGSVVLSYVGDDGNRHGIMTPLLNGLVLRSFSFDADGELYLFASRDDNPHSGSVFKAVAAPGSIRWDGDGSFNANRNNFDTEEGGTATISVERINGNEGIVTVDYRTIDQNGGGFATPDTEYTPTSGQLTWQDGEEGSKNFVITTFDDNLFEGSAETIDLEISNPIGGADLAPADQVIQNSAGQSALTGRLTINDNDLAAAPVGEGRQGGGALGLGFLLLCVSRWGQRFLETCQGVLAIR